MGYMDTLKWGVIKKDLQKGYEKGMAAMKQGAIVARKKAGELTEEGKRQYLVITAKSKIHQAISDLGARTYAVLSGAGKKNPSQDARVRDLMGRIGKLEKELAQLQRTAAPRKAAGRTAAKKKSKARRS